MYVTYTSVVIVMLPAFGGVVSRAVLTSLPESILFCSVRVTAFPVDYARCSSHGCVVVRVIPGRTNWRIGEQVISARVLERVLPLRNCAEHTFGNKLR